MTDELEAATLPIRARLKDERVLEITVDGPVVFFDEYCDEYFRCTLTRSEAATLGRWLVSLDADHGGD